MSKNLFLLCHYRVLHVEWWERKYIESILNSGCETTKCGISQGVWILIEGTVTKQRDLGRPQPRLQNKPFTCTGWLAVRQWLVHIQPAQETLGSFVKTKTCCCHPLFHDRGRLPLRNRTHIHTHTHLHTLARTHTPILDPWPLRMQNLTYCISCISYQLRGLLLCLRLYCYFCRFWRPSHETL